MGVSLNIFTFIHQWVLEDVKFMTKSIATAFYTASLVQVEMCSNCPVERSPTQTVSRRSVLVNRTWSKSGSRDSLRKVIVILSSWRMSTHADLNQKIWPFLMSHKL